MSTVYGVTAAMVSELANGLIFTDAVVGPPAVAATRPSLATITAWIARHAKIVDNAIEAPGADPASIQANATSGGYAVAQDYILHAVAAAALRSRDRASVELARDYDAHAARVLDAIKRDATTLGKSRKTAPAAGTINAASLQSLDQQPTADSRFWNNDSGRI